MWSRKDGRRNRYQIQAHLPLREAITREPTIGEVVNLLVDTNTREPFATTTLLPLVGATDTVVGMDPGKPIAS